MNPRVYKQTPGMVQTRASRYEGSVGYERAQDKHMNEHQGTKEHGEV